MSSEVVRRPPGDLRARWYARLEAGGSGLDATLFVLTCAAGLLTGVVLDGALPGLLTAGGILVGYVVAKPALRALLRPRHEYRREITDEDGLTDLRLARAAITRILAAWPQLGPLGGAAPQQTLDTALWDLAGDLHRRAEIKDAGQPVEQLLAELPADDPSVPALTDRVDELAGVFETVNTAVAVRVRRLRRLADECDRHLAAQATRARIEEVARRADAVLDGVGRAEVGLAEQSDPAAELAERTEAVLRAYRELQRSAA